MEIRSPNATRPWQHVLEPLSGYLTLGLHLNSGKSLNGESFNFGPNSQYSHKVKDIIRDLSKYWDIKNKKKMYLVNDNKKFDEAGLLKLNCDKALYHLKWIPTLDYKQLIAFTGSWYYNFYNDHDNMFEFTSNQIDDYEKITSNKKD